MRYLLILGCCVISFWSIGQDEAYYLTQMGWSGSNADLMRLNFKGEKGSLGTITEVYSFKDTIIRLDTNKKNNAFPPFQRPFIDLPKRKLADKNLVRQQLLLFNKEKEHTTNDTITIAGKAYIVQYNFYDDGYIGGRPNQVNQSIVVSDFGTVFSYANYFNAHRVFMLCHSDNTQQKVLATIYQYLATKNNWANWNRILELSQQYPFENCFEKLSQDWLSIKSHIKLTKCSVEAINREIHVDVTIKNTSDIAYSSLGSYKIASSKAFIHYSDSTKSHPWDLLDTHYGRHFKRISQPFYLKPNEEMSFSYVFPMYYGCGSCTKVTYSGFQIYRVPNFQDWLIHGKVMHEGQEYVLFPHREIIF